MIRGLYTSAMGMLVEQTRQDILANNMSNVNTTGFKRDEAVFKTFPEMLLRRVNDSSPQNSALPPNPADLGNEDRPVIGKIGTGAVLDQVVTSFAFQGIRETKNPFDLAHDGDGFFAVRTPQGERYTRNGSFTAQAVPGQANSFRLVTNEGYPVLDEQSSDIIISSNTPFEVDKEGRVWSDNTRIATLRVVTFPEVVQDPALRTALGITGNNDDNRASYKKVASSLYAVNDLGPNPDPLKKKGEQNGTEANPGGTGTDQGGKQEAPPILVIPPQFRRVRQGYTELSNSNPVREMVSMVQVTRAYEANQKAILAQDGTLEKAIGIGNN